MSCIIQMKTRFLPVMPSFRAHRSLSDVWLAFQTCGAHWLRSLGPAFINLLTSPVWYITLPATESIRLIATCGALPHGARSERRGAPRLSAETQKMSDHAGHDYDGCAEAIQAGAIRDMRRGTWILDPVCRRRQQGRERAGVRARRKSRN